MCSWIDHSDGRACLCTTHPIGQPSPNPRPTPRRSALTLLASPRIADNVSISSNLREESVRGAPRNFHLPRQTTGEVAHGICLLCKLEFIGETWLSLKESVGRIPFPVLFVDGDYNVDAVSATAGKLVAGNAKNETKPLTGVVIVGVNSQLPGGCGHSSECVGCILRNKATATFAEGITRNGMSSTHKLYRMAAFEM